MDDYYGVLGTCKDADAQTIKKRYHLLALRDHPDKNPLDPGAKARFQKLQTAYETLRDPDRRHRYDISYFANRSPPKTAWSDPARSNDNRHDQQDPTLASLQTRLKASQREMECLRNRRSEIEKERSAISNEIFTLRTKLHLLLGQEKAAEEEAKQRSTVWGWLFGPKLSDEEKHTKESARIDRQATRRIYEARMEDLKDRQSAKGAIYIDLGQSLERELRQSRELRIVIERKIAATKAARERADNLAKEQQRQNEKHREEEKHQKERNGHKYQQKTRQTSTNRKSRAPPPHHNSTGQGSQQSNCMHQCFWEKEEDQQTCAKCFIVQKKFAFRCPRCRMVACASCRRILRGK